MIALPAGSTTEFTCEWCGAVLDYGALSPGTEVECGSCGAALLVPQADAPERAVGRRDSVPFAKGDPAAAAHARWRAAAWGDLQRWLRIAAGVLAGLVVIALIAFASRAWSRMTEADRASMSDLMGGALGTIAVCVIACGFLVLGLFWLLFPLLVYGRLTQIVSLLKHLSRD